MENLKELWINTHKQIVSHIGPCFDHLNLTNAMMLVPTVLLTSALVQMVSHDQKYVTPSVDHLELTNAVVPLVMLSALHDADASTNSIT